MVRVVLLIVLLLAPSCSVSVQTGDGTPQGATAIKERPAPAALEDALLTEEDLRSLPDAPETALTRRSVEDANLLVNPDPRGPCGARGWQAPVDRGALIMFAGESGMVFEYVDRRPPGEARAVIDDQQADLRPRCPSFLSETPYGKPQENLLIRPVQLDPLLDQRVAYISRVTITVPVYGAMILLRQGDHLAAVVSTSLRQPSDAYVRALAERAAARLQQSVG